MIYLREGNIFESGAQALVNPVNTDGVMGKGLALEFKNRFPVNFKAYHKACKDKSLDIGSVLVCQEKDVYVVNFPTKRHWHEKSRYYYIQMGLHSLARAIEKHRIGSIAIPALGCGLGGLEWDPVRGLIEARLKDLNCDIFLFGPKKDL